MIALLHVVDAGADEFRLQSLRVLLDRLPADEFSQRVAATDGRAALRARDVLGREILRAERRLWIGSSSGPRLRAICREHGVDVIHAWGLEALAACSSATEGRQAVASGIPLRDTERAARWLRQMSVRPAVIASGQVGRARLLQSGVEPGCVAVVRGAVDFGLINRARERDVRGAMGRPAGPVVLLSGPVRRGDGSYETVWACAMLQRLFAGIRVVMPYGGSEAERLARLARASLTPMVPVMPGERYRWPELLTGADMLIVAPDGEAECEPIAWAMAAGVPVIGAARRSIAELIADRSNGLLCRTNTPRALASAILRLHEDAALRRKIVEVARGQAYEVFGVRGYVDSVKCVYANVMAGRGAADGVSDAAMMAP